MRPDTKARERAAREGVDMRFYSVIYNAIDDIENSLKGMLKPEFEEVQSGVAEIREVFRSSKFGNIAGVIVRSGTITRNAKARVIRDGVVVGDNLAIESLRRFKDDVTEVRTDFEAGIGLGKFNDIQIGDEIETIELKEKPRKSDMSIARRLRAALWAFAGARVLRGAKEEKWLETGTARKMADRIKVIVAERLEKGLRDPRLGFVTITDVQVTGDLQHASRLLHGLRHR